MSRVVWLASYVALFGAIAWQIFVVFGFIEEHQSLILTTPYALALIPLAFDIPDGAYYLRPFHNVVTGVMGAHVKYVQALLPIYAGSVFFWFTGLFLYIFSRVRRLERAYILFCGFVVAYLLLFVDYFTLHATGDFFLAYNIIIIAPFLYLYRSVYDLDTRGFLYVIIMILGVASFFAFPVRSASDEIFFIKLIGAVFSAAFVYCAYLFFVPEKIEEPMRNVRKFWAARIFSAVLIFAVALPPAFFFLLYYLPVRVDVNYNALFFLPSFFPIIFLTLSLRWGLVNFRMPISLLAVRILYFAFFGFLYWFTIGYSLGEIAFSDSTRLGHVLSLAVLLLLIDPVRTTLIISLDQYTSSRRKILDSVLLQSSQQIANPVRANHFISKLANSLSEGLNCYWAKIIMSRDLFSNWDSDSDRIIYLPPDDPFWVQAKTWVRPAAYPVLTQTFIGPVRDFLQARGAFLIICMHKFKAGVMISERRDNMPLYSEDIRFLRQVAKEAEILIQNYLFLIENVKLRRRERELAVSARIQKNIIPGFRQFEHFAFWSYSRAFESVTGDYVDLMQIAPSKFVVLLGDVSGHGISSGYLVAFARAYLRAALIEKAATLAEALEGLNNYLAENYRGNEFITLFALSMCFEGDTVTLTYVNAGQHPALLYRENELTKLEDSQRLLGVTPHEYRETTLELKRTATRLILYSDGAFDVFNKAGKILGEKRFHEWVHSSLPSQPSEQMAFLRQRIESYTGSGEESDDLALIIIEIS